MDVWGILEIIFGTTILAVIGAVIGIAGNLFNIRDRFKKWRVERKKEKFKSGYHENNPDFQFSLNFVSNPPSGKCTLIAYALNVSKELKFINSLSYHFEDMSQPNIYQAPATFINGERWPKRLEHGEKFSTSVDFSSTLFNFAFQYWNKEVKIYCTCRSSTGDFLRSNMVDFDKLVNILEPLSEEYRLLADLMAKKTGKSERDIKVSLWQLQWFGRLTVHIAKQLQISDVPVAQYLIAHHGLTVTEDIWFHWYQELEERKISPIVFVTFLNKFLSE